MMKFAAALVLAVVAVLFGLLLGSTAHAAPSIATAAPSATVPAVGGAAQLDTHWG